MAEGERDNTQDWILPEEARPATMAELEQRVDLALAVARSSEAAALEIGAAAIDAAEQARRAAELAERASARPPAAAAAGSRETVVGDGDTAESAGFDSLSHFIARADRVKQRLQRLP